LRTCSSGVQAGRSQVLASSKSWLRCSWTGEWLHDSICDLVDEGGGLKQVPYQPNVHELRRCQKRLNRETELDQDPFSDPVDLVVIKAAAERMQLKSDKDWHGQ
jgi:hypothetical protein